MPELPSITVYVERMRPRIVDQPLEAARVQGVALLRTAQPPVEDAAGRTVRAVSRMGKRIVWEQRRDPASRQALAASLELEADG